MGEVRSDLCPTSGGGFFVVRRKGGSDVSREPEVQGVRDRRTSWTPATSARTASARSRSPTTTRRSTPAEVEAADPGRIAGDLALRRLPALRGRARRPAGAGPDAAGARRPARRAARRRGRALDQERRRQPDPLASRTGSSPSPSPRRTSSASRPSPAPRPATSPTPSPPTPPPPASTPTSSSPPTSRSRSCSRPASTAPTWSASAATTTTSTGSAPQLAETRPWAFVNVNLRPYYAEGSKTLAYETVEQLGWELPDRVVCPIASGSLFTKLGRGFQEWLDLGLVDGEQPIFNGAQAAGLQPGRDRLRRRLGRLQAAEVRTRSPRAWRSATRPTAPMRSSTRAAPAAAIDAVADEEIRDGIRLLAETTGIFTETAGGVTVGVLAKLAERGEIGAGERVVVYITGEGLKTLDATRERFQMHEIDPDLDELRGRVPPGGSRLMAVTVKIPTQLRAATGGEARGRGRGLDRRRGARRGLRRARRPARADHPGRRPAPLRQRLRLRRGHPLPGRPRDLDQRRRRGDDPARRRRRLTLSSAPEPRRRATVAILCGGRGHAAAGADRVDAEGAGRDRRPADPLARDPDLRGAGVRPLPARDRLPAAR